MVGAWTRGKMVRVEVDRGNNSILNVMGKLLNGVS